MMNKKLLLSLPAILLGGMLLAATQSAYAVPMSPEAAETQQQVKAVVGIVLDETGEPVIGASVFEEGTKNGVVTDLDGKFSINVKANARLTVTYVGYTPQTVALGGRNTLRIVLAPASNELNEVVVTALGIKREKKALGYAMQEVKTDGLIENKSFSVANMLQGKVAGVQIAQSGTGLGGSTRIVMRGLNSLSGNNQPLWVVDGFPINDSSVEQADQWGGSDYAGAASEINPEDIESISVLKGANAAALYGSRAQNGAIVITTKKGRRGQPLRLEYNGTLDVTTVYSPYDYQNIYGQGAAGAYDSSAKASWGPKMTGQTVENWRKLFYSDDRYSSYALTPQKDYIKDFYRTGVSYSNTITATSGGENISGRLSFTDTRADDITPNFNQNRQYIDFHTEMNNKLITVGIKASYIHQKTNNRPGQGEYGQMVQLVKMPRGIRLSDLENPRGIGAYINNAENWSGPSDNFSNPYALCATENGNKAVRNRFMGQLSATVRFTDYLRLTGRAGMDWYNDAIKNYNTLPDPTSTASQYIKSSQTNQEFNADLILYFDKRFDDFSVNANLGTSVENTKYDALSSSSGRFAIPGTVTLANGLTQTTSEGFSKKEIQSVFAQATFGYKSMVYLDLTGRNDWSSTLPAKNRSYFYPSVSVSGIMSEMFKLPDWMNYWKLRASWAMVGNDTDPYQLATLYYLWTTGDKLDAEGDKVNPNIIKEYLSKTKALADLKPEKTNSFEIGTEFRFFNNRLGLDFTYYNTNTKDQILSVGMPGSSGYTAKSINAGEIKSHGFELMLNGTPVQTKDWQWDLNLNWGMSRTTCESLTEGISRFTLGETRIAKVVVSSGGKYGDIVGKAFKRDANGKIVVNASGLPEAVEDQVVGNMTPKWTGSVGSSLRYKDLTFSCLVDIRHGGEFVSVTDAYACQQGTSSRTLKGREANDLIVVDGVTESGQANTVGVTSEAYWNAIGGPTGVAEAFIHSGSYIKMRELSLGYILPQSWFRNTPIKYAKLSLVGRDLFYFHKNAPVNPEGAFSRSDYAQAFELASLPPTRSFGLALNVKF
ncbi:SusC/RagA family TonB-linked outer membrane protein [Segatella baroniae]|nr:SusC/RagA family TonB-linked outer membrane protein [Segatella baroniae]